MNWALPSHLVIVARVWIDPTASFIAYSHLHLVSVAQSNHVTRE
jgi:hypothetical protein